MGYYFDNEHAIFSMTQDINTVLKTVASRYIGQNPSYDVSYYAYQKNGIRQDNDYRFVFDFHDLYPLSPLESSVYAWSKLYSDHDMNMTFEISCFGPVIIYCNGQRVFKPNVLIERMRDISTTFSVQLKKGWNNFVLRFIRTNTGCGGTLSAISSRNRPQSFIIPSQDRQSQRGWLYTLPLNKPLAQLPEVGMKEEETGVTWYPINKWLPEEETMGQMMRMYSLRKNCKAIGWTTVFAEKSGEYIIKGRNSGPIKIYIDKSLVFNSGASKDFELQTCLKCGYHNILVINECSEKDWGFAADCFFDGRKIQYINPLKVMGTDEEWVYAGPIPLSTKLEPDNLYKTDKPFGAEDNRVYWRLDKPHTVIRPFNDNKLYGHWNYPLGVTLYGLIETGRYLHDKALIDYATSHVHMCTRYFDYALWDKEKYGAASLHNLLSTISTLDDCGSFGSLMLETSKELEEIGEDIEHDNEDRDDRDISYDYVKIADYIADFIANKLDRLPDGTLYRVNPAHLLMDETIWADDLYMSIPFLCRYYKMTGQQQYIDDAAKQLVLYHKYLYRSDKKIMSHVYDVKHKRATEVSWGRGNGWVAFSYSELLSFLPQEHDLREQLIHNFNELCKGYLALQDEKGLWHQVLTNHESYPESSCTSMFICAFSRGVRNGWLKEEYKYTESVRKAWKGLCREAIDTSGNVYGICKGSGFSFSEDYYVNDLGWQLNDTHGTGIVLLAGVEYAKLLDYLTDGGN